MGSYGKPDNEKPKPAYNKPAKPAAYGGDNEKPKPAYNKPTQAPYKPKPTTAKPYKPTTEKPATEKPYKPSPTPYKPQPTKPYGGGGKPTTVTQATLVTAPVTKTSVT